jgi:hypothetical protein
MYQHQQASPEKFTKQQQKKNVSRQLHAGAV